MKIKKLLILGITALSLGTLTVTTVQANSLPNYYSAYWLKTRTMHVKKAVYAYQINPSTWKTRQRKVLRANTKIKVANTANLSWVVKAKNLHHTHGYTWIIKGHYNTNWLKR